MIPPLGNQNTQAEDPLAQPQPAKKRSTRSRVISEVASDIAQGIVNGLGALWGATTRLLGRAATAKTVPPLIQVEKSPEDLVAEKIQAVTRGHLLRNKTILPSRIRSFLGSHLVTSPSEALDLDKTAILICRKVNTLLANRTNRGKSLLVESLEGNVRLESATRPLILLNLYITISPDGKQVSLQFQPNDPLLLGEGSFSAVFAAEDVLVETSPSKSPGETIYSRKNERVDSVRTKEVEKASLSEAGVAVNRKREARGNEIHQSSFNALQAAKRAGGAHGVYISEPRSELAPRVMKQRRYLSDLWKMVEERSISRGPGSLPITNRQLLHCIKDVAVSFKWLNQQGITHRDGKLPNINISYGADDEGEVRPIAHLADFGFAKKKFGFDPLAFTNDYLSWDPCCAYFNIATPYSETYATALMLLDVTSSPIETATLKNVRHAITQQVYDSPNQPLDPATFMPAGLNLTPIQQRAFAAFCGACYDSAQLARELSTVEGSPQSITHQHVTAALDKLTREGKLNHSMDYLIELIDSEIREVHPEV